MKELLLVGTGYMAREYANVLLALNMDFVVVGRREENCLKFQSEFPGVRVISGGLENFDIRNDYSSAIVASSVESLADNANYLLKSGVKYILIEKPGGTDSFQIAELAKAARVYDAKVLLAYNRRFYSSVIKAKEIIEKDGGVLSFNFEFTEWSHTIEPQKIDSRVKQNWFLANSTHVIDMAFYLGGKPAEISTYVTGSLSWHPSSSIFAGAGRTDRNALFTYNANWQAPGRWGVEVLTKNYRCIFRPLEKLQIQHLGSIDMNSIEIDNDLDVQFKPGLYYQTKAFIDNDTSNFCDIFEQQEMIERFYLRMSNY